MGRMPIRTILVPIDLGSSQQTFRDYAIGLAKQLQAELLFFAVLDSATKLALIERHKARAERGTGFRGRIAEDARLYLEELVERASEQGVRASGHAKVSEKIGESVVDEARAREVDLILVASGGHSLLWDFLFGDSSEVIADKAPCPVLTIKPGEEA